MTTTRYDYWRRNSHGGTGFGCDRSPRGLVWYGVERPRRRGRPRAGCWRRADAWTAALSRQSRSHGHRSRPARPVQDVAGGAAE
ncbi:MAG: hypothetical protein AB1648_09890 [Pseudomonadota bacterium]